uniref:Uncharacterized protein n=1 Tax=Physcomitrium patens TaxID=3218 RepID=A0A2K1KV19_PHYPA|nr:hypothetical protein PHYPA_004628 [Physcomitrium patens]
MKINPRGCRHFHLVRCRRSLFWATAANRGAFPRRSDRTSDWQLCATSGCGSTTGLERQKLSSFRIHFSITVHSGNNING